MLEHAQTLFLLVWSQQLRPKHWVVQAAGDEVRTWRDEWALVQRRMDKGTARQTLAASLPVPQQPLVQHGKELLRIMHNVRAKRQQVRAPARPSTSLGSVVCCLWSWLLPGFLTTCIACLASVLSCVAAACSGRLAAMLASGHRVLPMRLEAQEPR